MNQRRVCLTAGYDASILDATESICELTGDDAPRRKVETTTGKTRRALLSIVRLGRAAGQPLVWLPVFCAWEAAPSFFAMAERRNFWIETKKGAST
jgi:hypothetical protein